MKSNATSIILHLSDLHFKKIYDKQIQSSRDHIFGSLLKQLESIEENWIPNIVCITGDIIDKYDPSGFEAAEIWLKELAGSLNINLQHSILRESFKGFQNFVKKLEMKDLI